MKKLEDHLDTFNEHNFVGGTLIEYKDGCGFSLEWDRSKITSSSISLDGIDIKTDGRGYLNWDGLNPWMFKEEEGVFYLKNPMMYCYALAPECVEIPKPKYDFESEI